MPDSNFAVLNKIQYENYTKTNDYLLCHSGNELWWRQKK